MTPFVENVRNQADPEHVEKRELVEIRSLIEPLHDDGRKARHNLQERRYGALWQDRQLGHEGGLDRSQLGIKILRRA